MKKLFFKKILMVPFAAVFAVLFLLSTSVVILMAFEAHVVNVTATIERPKLSCDALSIGYWRNHEGCAGGEGESVWTDEIHAISDEFSDLFFGITGEEICQALWVPDCPSGNNVPAKRCRATAMTLADELNLVSGRLDLDALIAGADDGSPAFDHLHLDYNSTVREALEIVEMIVTNQSSSVQQLTKAAYVAERIYAFYEDENPEKPYCVMEPIIIQSAAIMETSSFSDDSEIEEDSEEEHDGKKNDENEDENEEAGSNEITDNEQGADETPIFGPFQEELSNEGSENATSSEPETTADEPPNTASSE